MTDKERILMVIVTRIIPGLLYGLRTEKEEYVKSYMLDSTGLQHGDLVYANTSIYPNDYMVGFIERVENEYVVVREIGSNRLCNYYNESFTKINKEKLGYEVLEGIQYKTYQKVLKAFSKYADYGTKFKSISFNENTCAVQSRKMFSNELNYEVSFNYDNKTSIKSIGMLLDKAVNKDE